MSRSLAVLTVALSAFSCCRGAPWEPGRLSPLSRVLEKPLETMVANPPFVLRPERVIKVEAVVPRRGPAAFGQTLYAGSLTVRAPVGDGQWLYDLDPAPRTLDAAPSSSPWVAAYSIRGTGVGWRVEQSVTVAIGYPALWFRVAATGAARPLVASLLGWGWAGLQAPAAWAADGNWFTRDPGATLSFGRVALGASPLLMYRDDRGPCTGALLFTPAPELVTVGDDGALIEYGPDVLEAQVLYLLATAEVTWADALALTTHLASPPTGLAMRFGCDGGPAGQPWVEVSQKGCGVTALPCVLEAPEGALRVRTTLGDVPLVRGTSTRVGLRVPDRFGRLLPDFAPPGERLQTRISQDVRDILAHQQPDGTFSFALGRSFYNGITCSVLAELLPVLPADLRAQTEQAVRRWLDYVWDSQVTCPLFGGTKLPAETEGFIQTCVDYPEIMSCVLQATAIYSAQADPAYARRRWADVEAHVDQLRRFTDWTGAALAAPGPGYVHVIAESAIGGYLGWNAVYQLALLADKPESAAEAKARAALAWQAFSHLFQRRPEYGEEPVVVNGVNDHLVELQAEPPWTYVQYAWFSYLPCLELPRADTFGVWDMLQRQPWWEWTGALGSTQRAYDYANALALTRAGHGDQVAPHWQALLDRPHAWESFDQTPVLEAAALAWLAGEEWAS